MSQEIRESINQQLIAAISTGVVPWKRPWRGSKNAGSPANVVSGRSYSGVNPILCDLHSARHGFSSRWFATWNQWNAIGGKVARRPDDVPPGQWGCHVVYFKPVNKQRVNIKTGELEDSQFFVMKNYTVFSADQVEGPAADKYRVEESASDNVTLFDFAPAEQLIKASGAKIEHRGDTALYIRPEPFDSWPNHLRGDSVVLPPKSQFDKLPDYYTTCFHELAHHAELRLGWDYRVKGYELGELVAEAASCYVAGELGMPTGDVEQHGAYLSHWLSCMRENSGYLIHACSQASRVTDFLLSKMEPRGAHEPHAITDELEV